MRRTNEKITDAIASGRKPKRRGRPRVISLATVGMTEEEQIQHVEAARARVSALGYRTDQYGRVLW